MARAAEPPITPCTVVLPVPEVISKSTQDADDPTDTTEYYGMQYTETIPVLLKAIQELTAKVEALEAK